MIQFIAVLLLSFLAHAAPPATEPEWLVTDLTDHPDLSAFMGGADALVTVKKTDEHQINTIYPTIFVYRLTSQPKEPLRTVAQWRAFLKGQLRNDRRMILTQKVSHQGQYLMEATSRQAETQTDIHSLYLGYKNPDSSVMLFLYDGIGPATARNLPHVKAFFRSLNPTRFSQLPRVELKAQPGSNDSAN